MIKYLYGASVQGIQGFIFETNKLREISGASNLVKQICEEEFENHLKSKGIKSLDGNKIIMAAGNIKYIFDKKEDCEKVFYDFPKRVMEMAPGITISQAVVKIENVDGEPKQYHINLLEEKLRTQRNKITTQHNIALMISERSRKTGNAGIKFDNKEVAIDSAQYLKNEENENAKNELIKILVGEKLESKYYPYDTSDLLFTKERGWIAVVHADGNSLGLMIQELISKIESKNKSVKKGFSLFSQKLDLATKNAAKNAYQKVINPLFEEEKHLGKRLPIRPVLIGGDDLTVIVRGDLAVTFTQTFLNEFKKETAIQFSELVNEYELTEFKEGITACAGIAFVKASYPLHYSLNLSESLCSYAKEKAKKIDSKNVESCLMFHKVQSSYIENYKEGIVNNELKQGEIYMNFGPYASEKSKNLPMVDELLENVKIINEEESPKSNIRNWFNLLSENEAAANQLMQRTIKLTNQKFTNALKLNKPIVSIENNNMYAHLEKDKQYTHLYDILSLASIEK